ncbi:MAG: arylesterase [Nevskia sp.]|nr:arylesterase [Nevskia sp.]
MIVGANAAAIVAAIFGSLRRLALLWGLLAAATAAAAPAHTILVFGDSLSAGYGLDNGAGWVRLLQQRLQAQAPDYAAVNASVSGETTAGGLSRLPDALARFHPDLVLLELGANDGLRALPVAAMRANLAGMIRLCRAAGAAPLLFAMRIPQNYGPVYTQRYEAAFAEVARDEQATLVPFFLAAVAADRPRWFQDDGIHPNAQAQAQLLDAVWPLLAPRLKGSPHPAGGKPAY